MRRVRSFLTSSKYTSNRPSDDFDFVRRTTFTYVNSQYDYWNRRPLGYQTVTAQLPAIDGESVGPEVITTYMNDHLAERGRVKSQTIIQDGTTWRQVINDWDVRDTGNGPYRAQKTRERTRQLFGATLVEQMEEYTHDLYGNRVTSTDYGFASGTSNLVTSDDRVTQVSLTGLRVRRNGSAHPNLQNRHRLSSPNTDALSRITKRI